MDYPTGLFAGLSTLDLEYVCASYPIENEKIVAERVLTMAGGPALNAAIAFSALGGTAELYSEVGSGTAALIAAEELRKNRVSLRDAACGFQDVLPVSTIVVNAKNASRTIVTSEPQHQLRANSAEQFELVHGPSIVLVDSYLPELVEPIAFWARSKGITVVFDGDAWMPWIPTVLALVDIAIVSENFTPSGEPVDAQGIAAIRRFGVKNVAVTRGPNSILWSTGAEVGEVMPPTVNAIDTLGAGDIFHGAFCYYFSRFHDFRKALASAARVASFSCTTWGTRTWIDQYQADPDTLNGPQY